MAWNLEEAVMYYKNQGAPRDQSMLIALLREIQSENGGNIPKFCIQTIAQQYSISENFLLAVIKRIPTLKAGNSHTLEICAGPNCGKCTTLAAFAERIAKEYPGEISLKYVSCMRMCGKGPNIKWDGKIHHKATETFLDQLIKQHLSKSQSTEDYYS